MRLLLILMQFAYFGSCKTVDKSNKYLFYESYSYDMHKGLNPIDTLSVKIQNFTHEYYFVEQFISDSISNIYLIQNKKTNYLDTVGCVIKTKLKNAQSILYVGKENGIYQSTEKNLLSISAYYKNDTINFVIDEMITCASKYGEDNQVKKLSGTVISRGASNEIFSFCLPQIDTTDIIEQFKTFEKYNLFRLKLKQNN